MNSRQLFKALYGMRKKLEHWRAIGHDLNFLQTQECIAEIMVEAQESGLSVAAITKVWDCAGLAMVNKSTVRREPSRHSVYIQMLVHTFGRVRRSF